MQILRSLPCRMRCGIFAESMGNLFMLYACFISCSMQISRKIHQDFTLTSMQNAKRYLCGIMRNLFGIQAEFMRNLSMPFLCLIPCSMQILSKFHADFTQTSMRWGIFAESMRNLSMPFACLIIMQDADFTQISRTFHAEFTQISMQSAMGILCGIHAESLRNPCGIYLCLMSDLFYATFRFHANFTQISRRLLCKMRCGSLGNPCGIYLCLIIAWFHAACRFHANFTQISRRLACKVRCWIFAESMQHLCRIHAESIYPLWMLHFMQRLDFTPISRRFYADLHAECFGGIFGESMRNLSMPYACLIPCSMQISRKFHADLTETSMQRAMRNLCRIFAESIRNLCGIYLCLMLSLFHAACRFHVNVTQISQRPSYRMRNPCRIFAESIYTLCMLASMQHAYFTQILCRFHRLPCGMRCRIFAESMHNLSMPYACLIPSSLQIFRKFYADFTQTSMQNAKRFLCGIYAESLRNPCRIYLCLFYTACRFHANFAQILRRLLCRMRCGIFAESMRNLSRPNAYLILCSLKILRKFHADLTHTSMQNAMRNLCGIHAESIYALCLLDFLQQADFTQISRRFHADFHDAMRNYCGIHVESLRNPCGIYQFQAMPTLPTPSKMPMGRYCVTTKRLPACNAWSSICYIFVCHKPTNI